MSIAFSLVCPSLLLFATRVIKHKSILKISTFILYFIGVLYLTILDRKAGENGQIVLTPFWTYQNFGIAQYRWQIYLNILLFLPLGFLIPWCFRLKLPSVIIIGFCFSIILESLQFVFRLGLCEIDDVIHNTIGSAIGYGLWKFFYRIDEIHGQNLQVIVISRLRIIKNKIVKCLKEK